MHRKRGFITSTNSDDTDQLLHLSSHISVFSIFASTRSHGNHTNWTGKVLTLLGVCRLNWVCLLYMQQGAIQSCWTSILAGMRTCAKPRMAYFFFSFLILVKIYERQLGNQVCSKYESAERKTLFFMVAFKWQTSWQSAECMSELWEDRPAYIFSSTAVWKFVINHVTNAQRAHFAPSWHQM